MFFQQHVAALAKDKGAKIKDMLIKLFWSRPAKASGRMKDNGCAGTVRTSAQSRGPTEAVSHSTGKSTSDDLPVQGVVQESPPKLRRVRTTSTSALDRNRMRIRQLLHSRKGRNSKAVDVRKEKSAVDSDNIFSYPVGGRAYEMPDEVKDELDVMACNEDSKRLV
jgi:hypothetical protein